MVQTHSGSIINKATKDNKVSAYTTLLRPILNNAIANVVWDPHRLNNIEMVQQ